MGAFSKRITPVQDIGQPRLISPASSPLKKLPDKMLTTRARSLEDQESIRVSNVL